MPTPRQPKLGPAMAALNERQQKFVIGMIETGGNKVRAALAAGYGKEEIGYGQNYHSAATAGSRLSHDPKVIAALKEQAVSIIETGTVKAAATLIELMDNPDPKVRLKASQQTLDRSGLQITHKQEVMVTHDDMENKSVRELIAYIKGEAAKAGIDPRKLLEHQGIDPNIIEGDYKEVIAEPADDNDDVIPTTAGLEDIL